MRLSKAIVVCASGLLFYMGITPAWPAEDSNGTLDIIVPRTTIYPGDRISEGLLEVRKIKAESSYITAVFGDLNEVAGQIARRTLLSGRAIPRDAVRSAPIIKQGEPVSVIYSSGSIQIQLTGTALQAGAVDDVISVRNVDTGRVVRAKIQVDRSLIVTSQ